MSLWEDSRHFLLCERAKPPVGWCPGCVRSCTAALLLLSRMCWAQSDGVQVLRSGAGVDPGGFGACTDQVWKKWRGPDELEVDSKKKKRSEGQGDTSGAEGEDCSNCFQLRREECPIHVSACADHL